MYDYKKAEIREEDVDKLMNKLTIEEINDLREELEDSNILNKAFDFLDEDIIRQSIESGLIDINRI